MERCGIKIREIIKIMSIFIKVMSLSLVQSNGQPNYLNINNSNMIAPSSSGVYSPTQYSKTNGDYMNSKCYYDCSDDCYRTYNCGPPMLLNHCVDVCRILCSNVPKPIPKTAHVDDRECRLRCVKLNSMTNYQQNSGMCMILQVQINTNSRFNKYLNSLIIFLAFN